MKKPNVQVFYDFVYVTTPAAVYTDAKFNDFLGNLDQTAIFAVADAVAGTSPTLNVQLQMSADGRNWVNKNPTAEISAKTISTTAPTALYGYDAGTSPSAAQGRLAIWLGGTTPSARIKIFVCDRDQA